jgi:uncharacterized repeat protein (TIGR01451 family)
MTRHVAANPSLRERLPLSRGPLIAVGTVAGIAAVFGANAVSNALAANSTPVAPGTNLPNIDVSVSSGQTVYARNASLSLNTTSDKNLVSPGTDVTFTYTLTDNGTTDFQNVRISDVGCSNIVGPQGNNADPLLNAGETWTYTCTTTVLTDQTNNASVLATPILSTANVPVATPTAAAGPKDGVYTGALVNEANYTLANGSTWAQNSAGAGNNAGTNVQVAAVVSGGKLTSVSLVHPTNAEVSRSNAPYVLQCGPNFNTPCSTILSQAAVAANSANIAAVSGSTFYSEAYKASLQDALTQAGF